MDTDRDQSTPTAPERDDRGASLVEYALLVALIAVVCIAAVTYFGEQTSSSYDCSGSKLEVAGTGADPEAVC